jgi:hypothetical protein
MKKKETTKRKVGRPVGSRPAGRDLRTFKVQEIITLSENKLIEVLKGTTSLPEKKVVDVALELYKRRVPAKVESVEGGNKLTILKIVKNHVPIKQAETIDVTTDELDTTVDAVITENTTPEERKALGREVE